MKLALVAGTGITMTLCLALTGCATPEQRAERMIARHGPVCDKLGFDRSSDGWKNCVLLAEQTEAQQAQASAAAVANVQRAMKPARQQVCNANGCY